MADEAIAEVDDVKRVAPSLVMPFVEGLEFDRMELDVVGREVAEPVDAGRPMIGGDVIAEEEIGFGAAGFSHEEKKSSSPCVASALTRGASTPSTTIRVGKLRETITIRSSSCQASRQFTLQYLPSLVSQAPPYIAQQHDLSTSS